jgi:hypothetical protein
MATTDFRCIFVTCCRYVLSDIIAVVGANTLVHREPFTVFFTRSNKRYSMLIVSRDRS